MNGAWHSKVLDYRSIYHVVKRCFAITFEIRCKGLIVYIEVLIYFFSSKRSGSVCHDAYRMCHGAHKTMNTCS